MQRFQKKVPENSSTKGPTTLSRTTFSIMTLSIMGLTATLSINDIQHNNTEHKRLVSLCSTYYAECRIFILSC